LDTEFIGIVPSDIAMRRTPGCEEQKGMKKGMNE
jgi:hypothetical protein